MSVIKTVDFNGKELIIRFKTLNQPEFFALLNNVKNHISGRVFVPDLGVWKAPPNSQNIEVLKNLGFQFLNTSLLEHRENDVVDESYKDLEIDFPRFKDLFPFQQDGVRFFESRNGVAICGDDMGVGKTIQAIGYLALHPELRPALIVCPATMKLTWKSEISNWLGERVQVLYGKKPDLLKKVSIYIINYSILCYENKEEKIKEADRKKSCNRRNVKYKKKRLTLEGWINRFESLQLKAVIVDECQSISNASTLQSRAVVSIAGQVEGSRLFLSGTPIKAYPSEFFTTLNLVDPISFPNEWAYLFRYCNPKNNGYGWVFKGITNEEELRRLIAPLMIRRMKTEVLKDLPEKIRSLVLLECDEVELSNYRGADAEFREWVKTNISKTVEKQQHIEWLKQLAYLAKRNSVLSWIHDFLSSGQKLIVFAYHTKVLDDLEREFKPICVRIDGNISIPNRQKAIERFQGNSKYQLFIGQIIAAGVGITLTASSAVAFVEFGWSPGDHDQAEDRANRIGQKFCVNCYYLVAEGTVDVDAMALLEIKKDITSGLLDGKKKSFFTDSEREKMLSNGLLKYMVPKSF
jgi:SWI/SNF-related matrix-associated actin-dependent regulator 1 of chromatin subfamily A